MQVCGLRAIPHELLRNERKPATNQGYNTASATPGNPRNGTWEHQSHCVGQDGALKHQSLTKMAHTHYRILSAARTSFSSANIARRARKISTIETKGKAHVRLGVNSIAPSPTVTKREKTKNKMYHPSSSSIPNIQKRACTILFE